MFERIANVFRGIFGAAVTDLERRNPEALLEVETENLRKQMASYNQGLVSHAALCERLMAQVRKLEAEQTEIRSKTAAHLRIGNRDAAAQYALRLQTVERELEENRKQLEHAETTYKELVRARDVAVTNARAKIDAIKANLSDLKTKRALAELTETASGMVTRIGGSGDTLDRLQTMVDEERSKAAGRVRVAQTSLDTTGIQIKESEQKALAEQALADFAAREGIALPPAAYDGAPEFTPVRKSMTLNSGTSNGGSTAIHE